LGTSGAALLPFPATAALDLAEARAPLVVDAAAEAAVSGGAAPSSLSSVSIVAPGANVMIIILGDFNHFWKRIGDLIEKHCYAYFCAILCFNICTSIGIHM
jgi:hypothetical protein